MDEGFIPHRDAKWNEIVCHIKIKNMSDLFRPAIRAYLQEACERAGLEVAADKEKTVTTAVKRKSLSKRILGTARV